MGTIHWPGYFNFPAQDFPRAFQSKAVTRAMMQRGSATAQDPARRRHGPGYRLADAQRAPSKTVYTWMTNVTEHQ
jgi:hypothetical protein